MIPRFNILKIAKNTSLAETTRSPNFSEPIFTRTAKSNVEKQLENSFLFETFSPFTKKEILIDTDPSAERVFTLNIFTRRSPLRRVSHTIRDNKNKKFLDFDVFLFWMVVTQNQDAMNRIYDYLIQSGSPQITLKKYRAPSVGTTTNPSRFNTWFRYRKPTLDRISPTYHIDNVGLIRTVPIMPETVYDLASTLVATERIFRKHLHDSDDDLTRNLFSNYNFTYAPEYDFHGNPIYEFALLLRHHKTKIPASLLYFYQYEYDNEGIPVYGFPIIIREVPQSVFQNLIPNRNWPVLLNELVHDGLLKSWSVR